MRTDQEINFLIERIQYRLDQEVLKKPVNKPIRDAYLQAIQILKNRETDPYNAGLDYSNCKNPFLQGIINQTAYYLTGDVAPRLVLFSVYPDGTVDRLDDLPDCTHHEPTKNTMSFSHKNSLVSG